MTRRIGCLAASLALIPPIATIASAPTADEPVRAIVGTTLPTDGRNIRQLALDGDPATAFVAARAPGRDDAFTLTFDRPVKVTSLKILLGTDDPARAVDPMTLRVSPDGATFEEAGRLEGRESAVAFPEGRTLCAVRLVPTGEPAHPTAIREIVVASEPAVATFLWPVEIVTDVTDAPEMKPWADSAAKACERAYPMICEALKSDGYRPARVITMTLKSGYKGVAEASGTRITGSVRFFKDHPDDLGAMVHETTHVVQHYRGRGNPSWLVEGVADYIRFFLYEPGKIGRIDPDRARYNASYRTTAAFLAYVVDAYDKDHTLIADLNRAMRKGTYREAIFREKTGKTLSELGQEWKASLKGGK